MAYIDTAFSLEMEAWFRVCQTLHEMTSGRALVQSSFELNTLKCKWSDVFCGRGPNGNDRSIQFSGVEVRVDISKHVCVLSVYDSDLFPFTIERLLRELGNKDLYIFRTSNKSRWTISDAR